MAIVLRGHDGGDLGVVLEAAADNHGGSAVAAGEVDDHGWGTGVQEHAAGGKGVYSDRSTHVIPAPGPRIVKFRRVGARTTTPGGSRESIVKVGARL